MTKKQIDGHWFEEKVDGMTLVDSYYIPDDQVEEYKSTREEYAEKAKEVFLKYVPTVERDWGGSQDGEAVLGYDKTGDLVLLIHLDPDGVYGMRDAELNGELEDYLLEGSRFSSKPLIGIIGAMNVEIEDYLKAMELENTFEKGGFTFYKGSIDNVGVVVVESSIGKVNAAICTQMLIDQFYPTHIINTGIAGAVSNDLKHLSFVVSKELRYHDFSCDIIKNYFPYTDKFIADDKLIELALNAGKKLGEDIHLGVIVTGDTFIDSDEKKNSLLELYDAKCTEMEGAAIAHTAFANEIPFIVIRSISDLADGSSHEDYEKYEKLAAEESFKLVVEMLKGFNKS